MVSDARTKVRRSGADGISAGKAPPAPDQGPETRLRSMAHSRSLEMKESISAGVISRSDCARYAGDDGFTGFGLSWEKGGDVGSRREVKSRTRLGRVRRRRTEGLKSVMVRVKGREFVRA